VKKDKSEGLGNSDNQSRNALIKEHCRRKGYRDPSPISAEKKAVKSSQQDRGGRENPEASSEMEKKYELCTTRGHRRGVPQQVIPETGRNRGQSKLEKTKKLVREAAPDSAQLRRKILENEEENRERTHSVARYLRRAAKIRPKVKKKGLVWYNPKKHRTLNRTQPKSKKRSPCVNRPTGKPVVRPKEEAKRTTRNAKRIVL